jgi:hypothetical protein
MARPTNAELDDIADALADVPLRDWHVLDLKLADREWAHVYGCLVARALHSGRAPWQLLDSWVRVAREDAEAFLAKQVHIRETPEPILRSLVQPLLSIGSEGAIRILQEILQLWPDAEAGQSARVALEILDIEPQDRIEALAAEWRGTRSRAALSVLYHTYIDRIPEGLPFGRWAERLGHIGPSPSACYCFTTRPPDEAALFVEIDAVGNIRGRSLK